MTYRVRSSRANSKSDQGGGQLQIGFNAVVDRREFMGRSLVAAVVFPGLLAAVLEACASGSNQTASKIKNLVIAMSEGDLRTLDPNDAYEGQWPFIGQTHYEALVTFKGADMGTPIPALATKWTVSQDGLKYVFDLNPSSKFWDNSSVTPEDVIFNLNRRKNLKGPGSFLLDPMQSVQKSGPNQVTIVLNAVNIDFLNIMTSTNIGIAKAATLQAHGGRDSADASKTDTARSWLDQHSAGTGQYVVDRWDHGSQLVVKRNPNYWSSASPLDSIVFKFASDANVQRDLLVHGDAHVAMNLTPDLADNLKGTPNIAIVRAPALQPVYVAWHANINPVLKNPASWDAIKYALDYPGYAAIYRSGGEPIGSVIPPALPPGLPPSEGLKEDLNKARAALAAAGVPHGFSFTAAYISDAPYTTISAADTAQKVAADLKRVGITVNLVPMIATQFFTQFRASKLEAVVAHWGPDYIGWTSFLPVFGPGGAVGLGRLGWRADATPDARQLADLTAKAMQTVDVTQQRSLVVEGQRQFNKVAPYAFLFETDFLFGVRTNIVNPQSIHPNALWYINTHEMELA